MKMPHTPPNIRGISTQDNKPIPISDEYIKYSQEFNKKYFHWDEMLYRDTGTADKTLVWTLMKISRMIMAKELTFTELKIQYNITEKSMQILHEIDVQQYTRYVLPDTIKDRKSAVYSVGSVMEESIASSQIEGATTTTKVAKMMLRGNKHPRDRSEQMILNNYNAMKFVKTQLQEPLSPELIEALHRILTTETLDDEYVGKFRKSNDIAVTDVLTGDVVHEPVDHHKVISMIKALCKFVNEDKIFIHPIIKGIIIHFVMAYIHPFQDGNGRVSRALFYWYTMKSGYWFMEYISISKSIKNHRGNYDRAYLLSETDDNDITYFIKYNLEMLEEAMNVFSEYLDRKLKEQIAAIETIDGLDLNNRQKVIISDMMRSDELISAHSLSSKYQVSMNTARNDIRRLASLGLIEEDSRDVNKKLYRCIRQQSK